MTKENNDVLESLARIEAILVELRNHFIREEIPFEVRYPETMYEYDREEWEQIASCWPGRTAEECYAKTRAHELDRHLEKLLTRQRLETALADYKNRAQAKSDSK